MFIIIAAQVANESWISAGAFLALVWNQWMKQTLYSAPPWRYSMQSPFTASPASPLTLTVTHLNTWRHPFFMQFIPSCMNFSLKAFYVLSIWINGVWHFLKEMHFYSLQGSWRPFFFISNIKSCILHSQQWQKQQFALTERGTEAAVNHCGWTGKENSSTYRDWTENRRKKDVTEPPTECDWQVISGESSAETPLTLALNTKDVRKIHIK